MCYQWRPGTGWYGGDPPPMARCRERSGEHLEHLEHELPVGWTMVRRSRSLTAEFVDRGYRPGPNLGRGGMAGSPRVFCDPDKGFLPRRGWQDQDISHLGRDLGRNEAAADQAARRDGAVNQRAWWPKVVPSYPVQRLWSAAPASSKAVQAGRRHKHNTGHGHPQRRLSGAQPPCMVVQSVDEPDGVGSLVPVTTRRAGGVGASRGHFPAIAGGVTLRILR
jgi:hypothetical protein